MKDKKEKIINPQGKKLINSLSYDDLLTLVNRVMTSEKLSTEEKKPILIFAHARLEKLLKQKEYKDSSISDAEYISKWGA